MLASNGQLHGEAAVVTVVRLWDANHYRCIEFDRQSGKALSRFRPKIRPGPLAGTGWFLSSGLVALYIDPTDRGMYVQHETVRFRMDGYVRASHRWARAGFQSTLQIQTTAGDTLELTDWVGLRRLLRPFSNWETESMDRPDNLFNLGDWINRTERRAAAFGAWNPKGQP